MPIKPIAEPDIVNNIPIITTNSTDIQLNVSTNSTNNMYTMSQITTNQSTHVIFPNIPSTLPSNIPSSVHPIFPINEGTDLFHEGASSEMLSEEEIRALEEIGKR